MDEEKLKERISTLPTPVVTNATASADVTSSRQSIIQDFLLIWVDSEIDQSNKDCQNILMQLRKVVNDVHICTQLDECINFLTKVNDMKIFLIITDTLGQQILPFIHDIPQLEGVYIFSSNKSSPEQWATTWIKVKGIYTEITPICECLQQAIKKINQDSIAMSFVTLEEVASSQNLDQLEPSFMYTQLFKEILLEMKYDQNSIKNFIANCRSGGHGSSTNINRFENDYKANLAIWWYTFPSFIYSMLNGALRMLEADTVINMGFFIHDLHHQIEELHRKQVSSYQGKSFVVYRGQGLSTIDFEKLRKTKGGLMSFNNFLSTSKSREVSVVYATGALSQTDAVGILFQMFIDPSVSFAPFASIDEVSCCQTEEEILFSMHTIFRIGDINQIGENNPLYQVKLTLTSDDDPQLRMLTEHIRKETPGDTGWKRLTILSMKIGQLNKAEELLNILFEQTSDEDEKAIYYNDLGYLKNDQGDYAKALSYHENGKSIFEKNFPPNHPHLATSYNNIGNVYTNMAEYSKALSLYEKVLEIKLKALHGNHPGLAVCYSSIGGVYIDMGEPSKALSFYEKALEIQQKTLPSNHPSLATSYNNIGRVYGNMGEYSKALSFYEKAREIWQKTLPPNHPHLATYYNNIGAVYVHMREYSKTLSFYEKALEIWQKSLPPNHPHLATYYNNIGEVYRNMGEYSKALSSYKKALEIWQKSLPPNHPHLATSYNNIGSVYDSMGEHSKALSFYEKALEIRQKTLPPNHPQFANSYNNIGAVYCSQGEHWKAFSFYIKALKIGQKTLPSNHPNLASTYSNIAWVFRNTGNYLRALLYFERALDISQRSLPPNQSYIQTVRESIEFVKKKL
jgi:tetratricopeptide (TPR) repeat protein